MNLNLSALTLREGEIDQVMALVEICHPTWPKRRRGFYEALNVFVVRDQRQVVAYTLWSLTIPPTQDLSQRIAPDALCVILWDTGVHPDHRGRGLSSILMDARLQAGSDAGAQMAIGAAHRSNVPMVSLLKARGFQRVAGCNNAFPDGTAGDVYLKVLEVPTDAPA